MVEGLRPPALDEIGLSAAIAQAVGRLTSGSPSGRDGASVPLGVRRVRPAVAVAALPALSAAVEVAAYRITTEAVANAVRHSGAHQCRVQLTVDGPSLRVEISDDGRGLSGGHCHGHGLETMRERAEELGGTLTVGPAADADGGGTTVTAVLPIGPGGRASRGVTTENTALPVGPTGRRTQTATAGRAPDAAPPRRLAIDRSIT